MQSIFHNLAIKSHQGFTLIELLVVISIIGVLSSTILVSLNSARDRANTAKVLSFSTSLQHALGADLVAAYTFNDGTAKDESGLGNNGTIYGGATFVNSIPELKKALSFDGVDDYVNAGNGASLNITSAITVEAWVKMNSKTAFQNILSKGGSFGSSTNYMMSIYNNYLYWDFYSGGIRKSSQRDISSLSLNTWYHIVGVYDGTYRYTYINGVRDTPVNLGSLTLDTIAVSLFVGKASNGYYFNGLIDEVRIYNQALSLTQIQQHYAEGLFGHLVAKK